MQIWENKPQLSTIIGLKDNTSNLDIPLGNRNKMSYDGRKHLNFGNYPKYQRKNHMILLKANNTRLFAGKNRNTL